MRRALHVSTIFALAFVTTAALPAVRGTAQAQSLLGPLGLGMFQPIMPLQGLPRSGSAGLMSGQEPAYQGSTRLPASVGSGPGLACRAAIRAAEQAAAIPSQLMAAIGRVESGRREPDGSVDPWPWSINAEGESHIFESKAAAIAAVRALQANGMRSIDVGCMQVNLQHHPTAFATLEQAFDPVANATYAARFLRQLHDQTGAWPTATAWYHSATPELGDDYRRKVMAVLPEERKRADDAPATSAGHVASPGGFAGGYAGSFHGSTPKGIATGLANVPGRPGGDMTLSNNTPVARIIPLAPGVAGRGLSAYRAAPIMLVARPAAAPPALVPPGSIPRGAGDPG
jgi:hypothetical protein